MCKTANLVILGATLSLGGLLGACATPPDNKDFLQDAAATCGAPDLLQEGRTYQSAPAGTEIDRTYDCVTAYLDHSPGYRTQAAKAASDRQFLTTMRQIEIARAKGLLKPAEAQAQAKEAIAAHNNAN